jgi:predicted RNase H-like HicB family nuclease
MELKINIFWSDEDKSWIAVPDWPPHHLSAFGDTPEAAMKEICTVIQAVIEEGAVFNS